MGIAVNQESRSWLGAYKALLCLGYDPMAADAYLERVRETGRIVCSQNDVIEYEAKKDRFIIIIAS